MLSNDTDEIDINPETDAAIRRAVRDELRGVVRALSEIGGGLLLGFIALPVVAGVLVALGAPLVVVLVASVVAVLALIAYGWRLPPFR